MDITDPIVITQRLATSLLLIHTYGSVICILDFDGLPLTSLHIPDVNDSCSWT